MIVMIVTNGVISLHCLNYLCRTYEKSQKSRHRKEKVILQSECIFSLLRSICLLKVDVVLIKSQEMSRSCHLNDVKIVLEGKG